MPERGSATICIPVTAADEPTLATVRGVIAHTDPAVPIVLCGSEAPLERLVAEVGAGTRVRSVVHDGAEVVLLNEMASLNSPADIALVAPGCLVAAGWLDGLRNAATSDSVVASATPLSVGSCGIELADLKSGDAQESGTGRDGLRRASVAELRRNDDERGRIADEVRASALKLCPRISGMGPGCVYIRRSTLDLVGRLEERLTLAAALDDVARRATRLGLVHVAADDVLVVGPSVEPVEPPEGIDRDESLPLRRSLNRAGMMLRQLSVTIDARSLTSAVGGTQTYVIELVLALARAGQMKVRVLVASDVSERATNAFATVPGIELLSYDEALRGPALSDVVHRPQQVFTPDDLALLRLVGRRIVVGHQDLIAYHNDGYHPNADAWLAYRRTTRLALAGADQVVFFSDHARRDALAEDLLSADRAHVVGIGADALEPTTATGERPPGLEADEPFLLCLGADYAHKNRPFAIELTGALREMGWEGRLVLSGARVAHGSSREQEQEILERDPVLARNVTDLGTVDEASKRWLYEHASALLYPTLYEGFGLIPVEAAREGLPCLFAAQASLAEVAADAATLVPWDAGASAKVALPILSEGRAREEHLARLRNHSVPGWEQVAQDMYAVYERAATAARSGAATRAWQELEREAHIVRLDRDIAGLKATAQEYQDAYHSLSARIAEGLPLIDEGGLLSPAEQRGLMRIASRRLLRGPILAPIGLLGHRSSSSQQPPRSGDRTGR